MPKCSQFVLKWVIPQINNRGGIYGTIKDDFGHEVQHPIYVLDIGREWWKTPAVRSRGINHYGSIPRNIYADLYCMDLSRHAFLEQRKYK